MDSPICQMTVIHYPDGRYWISEDIDYPAWSKVEEAVRRMDNDRYPIVQLNCTDDDEDEDLFNIIGGTDENGMRYALFHMFLKWQYEDPGGSSKEVRLWESDQGYFCEEKNILTDIDKVLAIVRTYYETGSYANLPGAHDPSDT